MSDWVWEYEGYEPGAERLRESLCTLGNGYLATRGAAPEATADEIHYPGTYVAGCYNRLSSVVGGRQVENEDMVNLPNWLPLRYRVRDPERPAAPGGWLSPDADQLTGYRQTLDLRHGTLLRRLRFTDRRGRVLGVEQRRLVHMGDPHLAAMRTTFRADGWSGTLELESGIDGAVANTGVARYDALAGCHLTDRRTAAAGPDTVWLSCRTTTSEVRVAMAARTRAVQGLPTGTGQRLTPSAAVRTLAVPIAPDAPVTVEKTV
ncbi:glycoside hydrolase family 65 protein, partial [Streptomyces sp. RKCA-744]|nr:glycoside hydrolase family 65 protein [Streptomyces sp. RKCA744]